jgi:Tfp pilus assembly protein PilF
VYRYHFGAALLQKGDKAEARKQLEVALASQPSRPDELKISDLLATAR